MVAVSRASDEEYDSLPAELDPSAASTETYVFPNNDRRRLAAVFYWTIAAVCLVIWLLSRQDDPVLVNEGWAAAALGLAGFGLYSWFAGYNLAVDQRDALVAAIRTVGFPVGHASAQLRWRGLRSRPTWYVVVYDADDPPERRALVLVDGVDGQMLEHFIEDSASFAASSCP